jgi:multidrug efflux pump
MILTNYAIKLRTAVIVFSLAATLIGSVCYVTLPREGMPDITIPYVFVTAAYEGTSPEEMEKLITVPLERQLNDIEGVKNLTSSSAEGVSVITLEFLAGEDIERAKQRVKDKVDLARPDLPSDLDVPLVQALNVSSDVPVFRLAISGTVEMSRLKALAEDLRDRIEEIGGVKAAEIYGAREREIRVEMDATRLAAYGISPALIQQRIVQENATLSAGNVEVRGDKFQVRVPGEFEIARDLRDITLTEREGHRVCLRDVAEVTDTFKDVESISRLNGESCLTLMIKKRVGENSVSLLERVKKAIAEFSLPPGVKLTRVYDESEYVATMIAELENNIASGGILVVLVLLMFMGKRNSLYVALAIPLSMLLGFTLMWTLGMAMNMIVLFSLVLASGMLVDNGIVIVENIYRLRSEGLSKLAAATRGAAEVAWPITTSTLTTVVAFAPLLFWPDIMGQFMSFLPKTLIIVLMASLFVGLMVNPAMCSLWISQPKKRWREGDHWFAAAYERLLRGALAHRAVILLLGFAFLALSVVVYVRTDRGIELFPATDPRNATINVRFPQGTSIHRTDEVLRRIEPLLAKYRDVEFYLSTAGASGGSHIGSGGTGSHVGHIHIEFRDFADREGSSLALVDRIRTEVGVAPGVEILVEKEKEGPPTGAPVSIELAGDDFDTLSDYSRRIVRRIETVPGLVDLEDDFEEALPELQFRVDRDRAAAFGLDTRSVAYFLRTSIFGSETGKYRVEEDEFDITVRLREQERNAADVLDRLLVPTPSGANVPLSSLGRATYTGGRGTISRKDQKRVITLSGNNQERGVDKIVKDIQDRLADFSLPSGYTLKYTGDTEEMRKNGAFLAKALFVAMALIFVILVVQFNSAVLPLIISFSVVLSLVGVMWGLVLTGMRFGVIMTGLGVISLAGVVVNNAIVLIDCIVKRQDAGMPPLEAIVLAGRTRLRPVLLTAVTTVLGLIPMAVGWSVEFHVWPPKFAAGAESSSWWAPMAVAVIFGLSVATVLTLVLVPVMYSVSDAFARRMKRMFGAEGDVLPPPGDATA